MLIIPFYCWKEIENWFSVWEKLKGVSLTFKGVATPRQIIFPGASDRWNARIRGLFCVSDPHERQGIFWRIQFYCWKEYSSTGTGTYEYRYRYRYRSTCTNCPMPHIFLILRGVIWERKNSCSLFCTESLWDWVLLSHFRKEKKTFRKCERKLNPIEIPYKITNTNFYRLKSHLSESEICGA